MSDRVACAFAQRKAFIPYITAGDPSLCATRSFVTVLAEAGADAIELGVPFSDPIADGPTNQRAAERSLQAGTTLQGILALVASLRTEGFDLPIVLFSYLNPILALGEHRAELMAQAGVDGVLAVDLPVEEAAAHERLFH
ncbi:tryptophan synthase subunit alpha, partial [Planctomycetota bacterium]